MLHYWRSAASDYAVEVSCAEIAFCCVPAQSFFLLWSKKCGVNCLPAAWPYRRHMISVPSKSRLSPVKLLICSQLILTQILSSVIFIESQWTVQGVDLSAAALVLLFRSLYLFSLPFLSKLLYFIMSAGINIPQSPFYVCLDAIFANVALYLALVSPSSFESSVLLNSFHLYTFIVLFFASCLITKGIFTHPFLMLYLILTKPVSCSSSCIAFRLLTDLLHILYYFLPILTQ